MLGVGSYAFRWSGGIGDRHPPSPITPAEVLDKVHALGVRLVQFADNIPLHKRPADEIDALAAKTKQMGMTIELGLTGCDPAFVGTYLDLARKLDAHLLRIAPSAEESQRSDAEIVALFRALLPAAADADVVLAVENHFHLPSPRLVRVIEGVGDPRLGVCLDVANSIACQEWPRDTIALLAPYAVNLHLKDFRIAVDPHGVGCIVTGTPLGAGTMDIAGAFEALERAGRSRLNVILEHWLPWQGSFETTIPLELSWLEQTVATGRTFVPHDNPNT